MQHSIQKNNAGLTLIELMFTAGVMTVGLVLLMGAVVNVNAAQRSADLNMRATQFNTSVIESLRGMDSDAILQYNADGSQFAITNNEVLLPGIGRAKFYMWCVVNTSGTITRYSIPMSDEALASAPTMANPMEIQVELYVDKGLGTGKEFKFRTSSLVYH